jgi:hypothetical protein
MGGKNGLHFPLQIEVRDPAGKLVGKTVFFLTKKVFYISYSTIIPIDRIGYQP